ncbi:hypothetical protein R6Q59_035163 [Mikania micrantha]
MMKLRSQHSVESMSDKSILENGHDPNICSNFTNISKKSKHPTYNELVDEVETLKETCATMQQILIEKNLMAPLPKTRGPSQNDTLE